jgi:hypothetical protein
MIVADDKSNVGGADRRTVAGDEPYEVSYFASKHGLTSQQARDLIQEHGNNRAVLDAAAEKLKGV